MSEDYIFYAYLKWLKDNKESGIYKLLKLPKMSLILLSGLVIIAVIFVIFIMKGDFVATCLSIMLLIMVCIISSIYIERYQIKNHAKRFNKYKDDCYKLYEWLKSINIKKEEEIVILKDRIAKQRDKVTSISDRRKENIEGWIKVVVIPVILAVTNNLLKGQKNSPSL